ncbi:Hsp20 family protein [Vibrio crassostreae]|uniref:Hsp20 family protein n=1 Tax=Vibrio crassostreae TaxID=246167 RepID=UPI001B30A569|nr:Hsp20 family protein [Vibrio crassostreae]
MRAMTTTIDPSVLLRAAIGFEPNIRRIESRARQCAAFPPYNIADVGERKYAVQLAVAGFKESEIEITVEKETLVISGSKNKEENNEERVLLHKGISERDFVKKFTLTKDVVVSDNATFKNGILTINMELVIPEEDKPVKIKIN